MSDTSNPVNHAAQLEADNERLRKELEVSKAWNAVAVAERNLAWHQLESLKAKVGSPCGRCGKTMVADNRAICLCGAEERPSNVDAVRHEHVLAAGDRLADAARAVGGPIVTAGVDGWKELDDARAAWTALVEGK